MHIFGYIGKKSAYKTLHYALVHFIFLLGAVVEEGQWHRSRKRGGSAQVNLVAFSFMQKESSCFGHTAESSEALQPFSHPLSLVATWRTLAVLGFYLILVSGGRTHPFFMVYMHTTTTSKELVPVPKRRFAFALFSVAFSNNPLEHRICNTRVIHISPCIFSLLCVLYW